jgi:PAS domain S-box-containing protein
MNYEQEPEATCVTNSHGRLLNANHRFCRLFGFRDDEVVWRYALDLYRNERDWQDFRQIMETQGKVDAYMVRLRHRKGRSFQCLIQSERIVNQEGLVCYQTTVHKIEANVGVVRRIPSELQTSESSVVYLTACHSCGKVKDSTGNWLVPMRPVAKAVHRKACYCPGCSAQLYPGLLDSQNWEQSIAAAR